MAKIVKDEDFNSEVVEYKGYALVDFWAEWCGPCKQMLPAIEKLSSELDGRLKILKMNVDENSKIPAKMTIRGIPAFLLFKDGQLLTSKVGAISYTALKNWVESHMV